MNSEGKARARAWITGAAGLIGHYLSQQAPPEWDVIPLTRTGLDFTDYSAVERKFTLDRPDLVLHCAALARSAACQENPALAFKSNVEMTRHLARLSDQIRFVFFSSDLVFDGKKGSYVESDPVNPPSVYGETKAAAEREVLTNPRHAIVRTSLNAGRSVTGDRGFNEELRRAWRVGQSTNLFVDEFRSPIAAPVTAAAVWELVGRGATGLWHVAGSERLSRFEIGELVARYSHDLQPRITSSSLRDYRGAPRSPDTTLDSSRAQALLSFPLPGFSEWLDRHAGEII